MKDMKVTLSTLWIFAMFNYIYADVFTVLDCLSHPEALRTGYVGPVPMNPGLLLGAAVLMETAIAMVLLSRTLRYGANRWANIIAGVIHTLAVIASLFVGGTLPTVSYYSFFATMEIGCTSVIVWYAWKWLNSEEGRAGSPATGSR